jgi:hypothetical protein
MIGQRIQSHPSALEFVWFQSQKANKTAVFFIFNFGIFCRACPDILKAHLFHEHDKVQYNQSCSRVYKFGA